MGKRRMISETLSLPRAIIAPYVSERLTPSVRFAILALHTVQQI
jgi:hypothetical protein